MGEKSGAGSREFRVVLYLLMHKNGEHTPTPRNTGHTKTNAPNTGDLNSPEKNPNNGKTVTHIRVHTYTKQSHTTSSPTNQPKPNTGETNKQKRGKGIRGS